jgi:LPXTG-motif cell wall-anchored protein
MKRMAAVISGAMTLVALTATSALAYSETPGSNTVVKGSGGGTAFTGSDVTTGIVIAGALLVVGLTAMFLARRRAVGRV